MLCLVLSSTINIIILKDPLLTAFELSAELKRLEGVEHEFKEEYVVSTFFFFLQFNEDSGLLEIHASLW